MKEKKMNLRQAVEEVLKEDPRTREKFYDWLFLEKVLRKMGFNIIVSFDSKMPHHESVTRCFTEETKVLSNIGYKNIKNIEKGDLIFTHNGNFKVVKGTIKNKYVGNIFQIKICGNYSNLRVTPEHPFLVGKLKYKKIKRIRKNKNPKKYPNRKHWVAYFNVIDSIEFKWKSSNDLRKGDILIRPIMKINKDIKYIKLEKMAKSQKKLLKVDDRLLRIFGYYLSEGFLVSTKYPHASFHICFTFGKNEKELSYVNQLCKDLNELGFKTNLYWREKFGWKIFVSSKQLFKFLKEQFGTGAKNKKIPFWITLLPKKKIVHLFESYVNGDGCRDTNGHCHTSSVSMDLSEGFKLICEKLGYKVGIYRNKPRNSTTIKNFIGRYDSYRLRINNNQRRKWDKHWIEGNFHFSKISSIKKEKYNGEVYNLEVEEDESYVTNLGAVHNCRRKLMNQENKYNLALEKEKEVRHFGVEKQVKHYPTIVQ